MFKLLLECTFDTPQVWASGNGFVVVEGDEPRPMDIWHSFIYARPKRHSYLILYKVGVDPYGTSNPQT